VISELQTSSLKEEILRDFQRCRAKTLALFEGMDDVTFRCLAHPDFSPIGWHLGHIAFTESLWIIERSAKQPGLFPEYRKLFAADGLPKHERVELPSLEEIRDYLNIVRKKVVDYLEIADLETEERLWRFLLQHESQHCETASIVQQLINTQKLNTQALNINRQHSTVNTQPSTRMIEIPAGEFQIGNNSINALDNERPKHRVYLDTYYIDICPVTCGQYRDFIQVGGYTKAEYWSESGWQWLQIAKVKQPLYWQDDSAWDNHPVCGVSWYEAEAYARFMGKRLPTEAEWEKAASWDSQKKLSRIYPWGDEEPIDKYCNHNHDISGTTPVNAYPEGKSAYGLFDTLGNVWEWTESWFDGYKGFLYYPYPGYSQVYFDKQHRVLKGGSWATRPWALRCSFRNWYYPEVRQIFAGFRCVTSASRE
jgi:gamma-glutamyl hercynylcysteine S-oxide synthase